MELERNPRPAELIRALVGADPGIDPHRLVRLCCQQLGAQVLGVTLLIPVDDEPRPWAPWGSTSRLVERSAERG